MLLRSARKSARAREAEQRGDEQPVTPSARSNPPPMRVTCDETIIATIFTPLKITITNDADGWMLFKLQTNIPQRYRVNPEPFGLLAPGAAADVEVQVVIEDDVAERQSSFGSTLANSRNSTASTDGPLIQPRRSRSASSRSLAGLLRYRTQESADDINAESRAAILHDRTNKRASYLARRNSEVREPDLSMTRRTLQMSFMSGRDSWGESVPSDPALEGSSDERLKRNGSMSMARAPSLMVAPQNSSFDKAVRDLIRIEGRLLQEVPNDLVSSKLATSRDDHRDAWAALPSSHVVVVPIRSEPVSRSQFASILSDAEPVGVQLLREDKAKLQTEIRELQRQADFQSRQIRDIGTSNALDRRSLEVELEAIEASLKDREQEVLMITQQAACCDEDNGRHVVEASCWDELCSIRAHFVASTSAISERDAVQLDALRKKQEVLIARFGNNPYPRDATPLQWLGSIVVPSFVGWLALLACMWTTLLAPLLLGCD